MEHHNSAHSSSSSKQSLALQRILEAVQAIGEIHITPNLEVCLSFPKNTDADTKKSIFNEFLKFHKIQQDDVLYDKARGSNQTIFAAAVEDQIRNNLLVGSSCWHGATVAIAVRTGIPGLFKATFRCLSPHLSSAVTDNLPHLIGEPVLALAQKNQEALVSTTNIVAFYKAQPQPLPPLPFAVDLTVVAPNFKHGRDYSSIDLPCPAPPEPKTQCSGNVEPPLCDPEPSSTPVYDREKAREHALAALRACIPPKEELDAYNARVQFMKSAQHKTRPQTYSPEVLTKRKRGRPPNPKNK